MAEQLSGCVPAAIDRALQGRISLSVPHVDDCAVAEQGCSNRGLAPPCRHMQWSRACHASTCIDVSAGLHKHRLSWGPSLTRTRLRHSTAVYARPGPARSGLTRVAAAPLRLP